MNLKISIICELYMEVVNKFEFKFNATLHKDTTSDIHSSHQNKDFQYPFTSWAPSL